MPEYIWDTMRNVLPGTKCPVTHMGKRESKKRTELTNKYKYCKVISMQAGYSQTRITKEKGITDEKE